MVYHTFRNPNYNHKRVGRRRAALSRRRKRKWKRKSTASKALVTAKRAYRLARILKKPGKYVKWSDPFELYNTNFTYGVAAAGADGRYHWRHVDTTGNPVQQGLWQTASASFEANRYVWDWKQHPFPVCSRIRCVAPGPAGATSFQEILPRLNGQTFTDFMHIGHLQFMRMFNNSNSMTDGSCLFDFLLDAGPLMCPTASASYAERKLQTVVGITCPINLMPRIDQSLLTTESVQMPTSGLPHKSSIKVSLNFRIRDAAQGTLRTTTDNARRDFSPQVVHTHVYLVEIPVGTLDNSNVYDDTGNSVLFQALHGGTEGIATGAYYGRSTSDNSFAAAFLKNIFETDVLNMASDTNRSFYPKIRKGAGRIERMHGYAEILPVDVATAGARTTNNLDDQKFSTNATFDDADSWALYARRWPFKILEHKAFRLGAKSSSQDLAIYEHNMSFRIKKTMRYKQTLALAGGSPHMVDTEYRIIVIHNGQNAIQTGVSATGASRGVEVNTATGLVTDGGWHVDGDASAVAEGQGNILLMAAQVEHGFQEK